MKVTYQNLIKDIGGGGIEFKFTSTKKNSGFCGTPINTAMRFLRGKYIFFVDSDDLITKTALEEVYNLAEKYQADVVHTERFFMVPEDWKIDDKREKKIVGAAMGNYVTEPTFITENFTERAQSLRNYQFDWALWLKFFRRDFLADNDLKILDTAGQDLIGTCCIVSSAKKYLRVPNVVNIARIRSDSESHRQEKIEVLITKWTNALVEGFSYVNDFLSEQEYFQKNLDAKYLILETVVYDFSRYLFGLYTQFPACQLDALIQQEFAKCHNLTPLTTFIFSRMNIFNINLIQQQTFIQQQQELINQLQTQLKQLEK